MDMHTGFNNLDYVILAIILISGLLALTRGFVSEVFSLIAWVGAYFAAIKLSPLAEPWVHTYIHNSGAAAVVAAFAVFFVTLVVLSVIGNQFSDLIKDSPLTSVDRSLGFVFGILRGLLVICLVYLCLVTILWPEVQKLDDKPVLTKTTEKTVVEKNGEKVTEKTTETESTAPEWLVHSHFRPALVYGANILKSFIPENLIDKTKKEYFKGKDKIEVMIDEHKPETIRAASPPPEKPVEKREPTTYDEQNRTKMNSLIDQKGH